MIVTLRTAHRIVQRLDERLKESEINTHSSFNIFEDVDLAVWLEEKRVDLRLKSTVQVLLLEAKYTIRRLIQEANEEQGINENIARKKILQEQRQFWISLKQNGFDIITVEALAKKQEVLLSAKNGSEYSYSGDYVNVNVISDDMKKTIVESIAVLQKRIDACTDLIAAQNVKNEIVIEDTQIQLLEQEGVI